MTKLQNLFFQAILCYQLRTQSDNVVSIPTNEGMFSLKDDPTRMLSIHCLIHPKAEICRR